ncbi:hypothetical protein NYE70_14585 [Paenibacillus sp. FSL R5-0407]|uniref:hypothetical protein n=1 Tax=Paenibacillus sp. FSL R5-0407 TaxID=2975320 RepID=UPI0030FBA931
MFTSTEIYNIVLAETLELDWDCQDNLQNAYETFNNLPMSKQKKFNKLVKQAVATCQTDFKSFPENYLDPEDLVSREESIYSIIEKLEPIFVDFLQ